jgi:hypothetical protein
MIRRLGLILGLLVLLALAAAWAFPPSRAAHVLFRGGWVVIGAGGGKIVVEAWRGAYLPDPREPRWGTRNLPSHPAGITDDRAGGYIVTVRVPIWPVMLVVAAFMAWRWRRRTRQQGAGFEVESFPAQR